MEAFMQMKIYNEHNGVLHFKEFVWGNTTLAFLSVLYHITKHKEELWTASLSEVGRAPGHSWLDPWKVWVSKWIAWCCNPTRSWWPCHSNGWGKVSSSVLHGMVAIWGRAWILECLRRTCFLWLTHFLSFIATLSLIVIWNVLGEQSYRMKMQNRNFLWGKGWSTLSTPA